MRLNGDRLRARYVAGDAASAPLLKATLVPVGAGTRIVGSIYWGAMYVSDLMYVLFAFVGGLAFVSFLVATHDWIPALILAPVVLTGGWLALSMRDTDDVRGGYEKWFRQSLADSFESK